MKNLFSKYIAQFVYGAVDGTVTTFAVIAAAAGGGLPSKVVIIMGLANLIADGFSMGASAFLSDQSEDDLDRRRRRKHVHNRPLNDAIATFSAFVVVGFIPMIIYVIDVAANLQIDPQFLFKISAIMAGVTFIIIGAAKGKVSGANMLRSTIETFTLGAVAAVLAYSLGDILARLFGV